MCVYNQPATGDASDHITGIRVSAAETGLVFRDEGRGVGGRY